MTKQMDEDAIREYIRKIDQLNKMISDDENSDELPPEDLMEKIDTILNNLSDDILDTMKNNKSEMYHSTSTSGTSGTSGSNTLEVKVKKLRDDAVIPAYSKDGDAGMDLTITHIISETEQNINYGYGLAFEIPKGYVGLLFPRSSIRKYGLVLSNCVGVIDSGYRGEIQTMFKKTSYSYGDHTKYKVGERGAQLIIIPYPQVKFMEVNNLSESERNDSGFGSTGK